MATRHMSVSGDDEVWDVAINKAEGKIIKWLHENPQIEVTTMSTTLHRDDNNQFHYIVAIIYKEP